MTFSLRVYPEKNAKKCDNLDKDGIIAVRNIGQVPQDSRLKTEGLEDLEILVSLSLLKESRSQISGIDRTSP